MIDENEQLSPLDSSLSPSPDPREPETSWRSVFCTSFLSYCMAAQFSLYFAGLWPFLKIIEPEITESFFGYVVGIYSCGQIIASPLVGFWSNKIKQISVPLYTNLVLMIIGNGFFVCLENFGSHRKYWLLFARFIIGFGSSNISLLKSYTSSASTTEDRSRAIAYVTGGVALGMTMGPAFQFLFLPLDYPGIELAFGVKMNMYTAPGYMAIMMNLVCALATKLFFREHYAGLHSGSHENGNKLSLPPYDMKALLICHLTRFTQILVNTNMEVLGSVIAMAMFGWTKHDVVKYISFSQAVMSFLAFLTYLLFIVFNADRFVSFRKFCVISLVALIAFHLLTYSWPFLSTEPILYHGLNTTDGLGCDVDKFEWCRSLKPVNVGLFYVSYILFIGIAFPQINISLNTLFSKIIGPRRQGTHQGFLQVSGGVARMVGPVLVSALYTSYGPRAAWAFIILEISVNLILWVINFHRMVPLQIPDLSADDCSTFSLAENCLKTKSTTAEGTNELIKV